MDQQLLELLRRHGWDPGELLGAGMEGTVIDLSPDRVAKVWHGRTRDDLLPLLRFGAALGRSAVPFRVSRAVELLEADDFCVTIDEKVHGRPLRPDFTPDPPVAGDEEARLMGDALAGLSSASVPELAELPVLPTEPAFDGDRSFVSELADLVQRRFDAHPDLLRRAIDDIDDLVPRISTALRGLPEGADGAEDTLVHGDLIPANVLVEDDEVSGVVDFGFLTTLGDPHFDAAITASVFDMYGTNARESEDVLSKAFAARFDHDPARYGLYRAAYAVITNVYFGQDGTDGHFAWCVSMLRRPDVAASIPS